MTHFIFDCDDVLLDWQSGFLSFLNDHGIWPDPAGPTDWALHHWIGGSDVDARYLVRKFNASVHFGYLKSLPDAFETVWTLRDEGHTVSVLTSCGNSENVAAARCANLERNFSAVSGAWPFSWVKILDLGESKRDALKDCLLFADDIVFIEDNYDHAKTAANLGIRAYCLRRTHNRAQESNKPDPRIIWIDNLKEIENAI